MPATLAEAYVLLKLDQAAAQAQLKTELPKSAEEAGKESGSKFSSGFKTLIEGAAALGAVEFFKGTIEKATDAQKTMAQTEAVIKSTGGAAGVTAEDIETLSGSLSKKIGVDKDAIASSANLLLTFTNVKNQVGAGNDIFNQATSTIQDMSAALGQSSSTSAIQLGKALNDPIKGITALQRVGVTFTDAQKKQITTMEKSGNTMGAQKLILGELNREFGGSAAAIATPGDKMKVAWDQLQETIGTKLLPVLAKLIPIVEAIIGFVAKNSTWLGILAGAIGVVVAAIKVWEIIQAVLDSELIANPIGLVVIAIAALVAGIIWVATKTQFFQDVWRATWDFLKKIGAWFAGPFVNFFVDGWHDVEDAVTKAVLWIHGKIDDLKDIASHAWDTLKSGVTTAVLWVHNKIDTLVDDVESIPHRFTSALSGAWSGLEDGFRDSVNWIIKKWNGLSFSIPGVNTHIPGVGTVGGFTINTPNIPLLANGGVVNQGGRAIVGDAGPEILDLPTGARVTPLGAAGNTYNLNAAGMTPYELALEIDWLAKAGG